MVARRNWDGFRLGENISGGISHALVIEIIRDHVTMGLELCCRAAADANEDGIVNVNDAVLILNALIDAEPTSVDCELTD